MRIPGRFVQAVQQRLKKCASASIADPLTGLTLRVGHPVYGACASIEQSLKHCTSTLLIGPAGVGKSTVLREMTRVISDTFHKCVVVVDTTSELGGFGQVPHEEYSMYICMLCCLAPAPGFRQLASWFSCCCYRFSLHL